MSITDELIAAYADGELAGEQKAAVEAALGADPALARKVEAHQALKLRLASHYAPVAEMPVPTQMVGLLFECEAEPDRGTVASFAAARQKRGLSPMVRRWAPFAGPALAASVVLALWQPWQSGTPDGYAAGDLAAALDTQLAATQPAGADTWILVSFPREGGSLCRAWRGAGDGGIACRDEAGWKIERRFALEGPASAQFRQAGSEAELLAVVQDMAAGEALDAEAERAAKTRDWKN